MALDGALMMKMILKRCLQNTEDYSKKQKELLLIHDNNIKKGIFEKTNEK